jgi:hypothetical protein
VQAIEEAGAKGVWRAPGTAAHDADQASRRAKACGGVDKDGGSAAWKGADKGSGLRERLVEAWAHDLDEQLAQGDDLWGHGDLLGRDDRRRKALAD